LRAEQRFKQPQDKKQPPTEDDDLLGAEQFSIISVCLKGRYSDKYYFKISKSLQQKMWASKKLNSSLTSLRCKNL
jgi:hypothetical protein